MEKPSYLIVCLILQLLLHLGCGNVEHENASPIPDENSNLAGYWGIEDEVGSKFVYLRGQRQRGKIQVVKKDNSLTIKDNLSEITAVFSSDGQSYEFSAGDETLEINCAVPVSFSNHIDISCVIAGENCNYSMEFKGDGYEESSDTCEQILTDAMMKQIPSVSDSPKSIHLSKNQVVGGGINNSWNFPCDRYGDLEPAICSNVVNIEGIKYYHRASCSGEPDSPSASSDATANSSNVLKLLRVYSEDEKEGCFLFICNGPHGNLHFVVMPYNKNLLSGSDFQIAAKIREAESQAPVSLHTIIPGAYQKDNQCEWYETDAVGYQDVYYDNKIIWDWDNFCIGVNCPYKLVFTIYESDEQNEWFSKLANNLFCKSINFCINDDFIGYGVIRQSSTVNYESTFSAPKFKMAFRTSNYETINPPNEFITDQNGFESKIIFETKYIKDIFPDPKNNNIIWVATVDDLIRWDHNGTLYDSSDDIIENFNSKITGGSEEGAEIEKIASDNNGGLWFVGNYGLAYLDSDEFWTTWESGQSYETVTLGGDGSVYVSTGTEIYKFTGKDWIKLLKWSAGFSGINNMAYAFGKLWFNGYNDGLYYIDSEGGVQHQDFFWEEGLNEAWIRSILAESPDRMWFGTDYNGLYVWDIKSNTTTKITKFFENSSLPPISIDSILMGKTGKKWISTNEGIVFMGEDLVPHNSGIYNCAISNDLAEDNLGRIFAVGFEWGNHGRICSMIEKPQ